MISRKVFLLSAASLTVMCASTPALAGPALQAAVLPSSRSTSINTPVTIFASMINGGNSIARSCSISLRKANLPVSVSYQAMQADNSTPAAGVDTPVDIAAGASQAFVVSFTANAPVASGTLRLNYSCSDDAGAKVEAPVVDGVNALSFSASATPSPDVLTIAQSASGDGYIRIPTAGGAEAMAISAVNIGAGTNGKANEADLIAMPDTGNVALPVSLFVCETDAASGACLSSPTTFIHTKVGNTAKSYTVFANADPDAGIPDYPDLSRVYLRFYEETTPQSNQRGAGRGATGLAVTAPAPANSSVQTSNLPEGIWEARFSSTNGGYNEGLLFISAGGALNAIIYSDGNGNHDGGGEGDLTGHNNNGDVSGDNGSSDNSNGNGDNSHDGTDNHNGNGNGNGSSDNHNGNGSSDNGNGNGSSDTGSSNNGNGSGDKGNGSGDNSHGSSVSSHSSSDNGNGSADNNGSGDNNHNGNSSGDNDNDGDGNGSNDNDNDGDGNDNSTNRTASATLFAGTVSTDGSGGWTSSANVLDLSKTVGGVAYQLGGNWNARNSMTGTYAPSTGSTIASIGSGSLRAAFSRDYDRTTVLANLGGNFDFYDGNADIGDLTVSSAGALSGTYAFPGSTQVCNVSGNFASSGASANLYSVTISLQGCAAAGTYSGQATLRVEDDNRSSTVNPILGMAMTADNNRGMVLDLFPKGHVRSNDR